METVRERSWMRLLRAAAVVSMAAAAFGVAFAGSAAAGEYHVYSCRTPAGEAAPVDGWSGSVLGLFSYARNTCSQSDGALIAALGAQPSRTANTDIATWQFGAPTGATIAAATLWRAGDADGGIVANAMYEFWLAGPSDLNEPTNAFGVCVGAGCAGGLTGQPFAAGNRLAVPRNNLGTHLYVHASCVGQSGFTCPEGKGDANGYAAVVRIYAADLTLEQNNGPTASSVSGELTSAAVLRGDSDVAFNATDPGAGVYEALFSVDGRVVQATVVNGNGGRCRDVGQTTDGRPAFLYVQPCLGSVSVNVPFDSTRAGNGVHHLIVSVMDAAGNSAPVLDRTVTVDNPPPPGTPNGTNASSQAALAVRWKRTSRPSLMSPYGRGQTVTGRLTAAAGTPISGALIDVRGTPAYTGARPLAMAPVRTDRTGRFSVHIAPGASSRTLRFAYRSHLGDTRPAAVRTLILNVHAGIALRVAPRTASVGSSIFFRGRLRGGPIPKGGKQLVLEARSPGSGWIQFHVIRTDRHGGYRASYRFKFAGPADYRFRVRSEAEADYPFAAGSSNVVAVHER